VQGVEEVPAIVEASTPATESSICVILVVPAGMPEAIPDKVEGEKLDIQWSDSAREQCRGGLPGSDKASLLAA
jgi:hypothetical protein